MKKTTLSIVSILALSGLSYAGGNVAPIEEPVAVAVAPVIDHSAFYIGVGIGESTVNDDWSSEEFSATTIMLQAGYQYNEYLSIEGRYTFGFDTDYDPGITNSLSSDYDGDISNWGIYLKPMYPVGNFTLYALLGYGGVMLDDLAGGDAYEDGFQWGLGAGYSFTEEVSVFVDYVSLYDDTGFDYRAQLDNIDSNAWTLGVSYKF